MLASWDVAVEAIDVEARPAARAELARLGVPAVPAVVLGSRVVHGWNPRALAELLGVAYTEPGHLSPSELAARLDRILLATQRVMRQVPPEHLALAHPERDRSVHQLGYHVFRLALAFRDARLEGGLRQAWLQEMAPGGLADGPAVATYGDEVREKLRAWLARPEATTGEIETYYGRQTAHALLERTTWHAAQHLRQLYDLLGRVGIAPDRPLGEADWEGLPLPVEIW